MSFKLITHLIKVIIYSSITCKVHMKKLRFIIDYEEYTDSCSKFK